MKSHTVTGANGKPCGRVGGTCSCCGAGDGEAGSLDANKRVRSFAWYVYRAGWTDSDGIYYARLCGDEFGAGCITEVRPAEGPRGRDGLRAGERARLLRELMPGEEDDGVVTEMEDSR